MKKIAILLVITTLLLSGCNGIPNFSKTKDVTSTTNTKKISTKSSEKYDTIAYGEKTIKFNKMEAKILNKNGSNAIEVTGQLKDKVISLLNENITTEKVKEPFKNEPTNGISLRLSYDTEDTYIIFTPENNIKGKYYVSILSPSETDYLFIKADLSKSVNDLLK